MAPSLSRQHVAVEASRRWEVAPYTPCVPKIWSDTIETHRRAVHDATLEAAAALVAQRGLRGVTMSQIAEETGIGRATLYKYFPDVEAILGAWHEREIGRHLEQLADVRDRTSGPRQRLESVLAAYAQLALGSRDHGDPELAALLHRDDRVAHAEHQLHAMVRDLVADAVASHEIRGDVDADELATYCLAALGAARRLHAKAAVTRLVQVTLDGLRRPG